MKGDHMKTSICTITGLAGSILAAIFGGWDSALATLLIFMAADYITGLMVAGVFHASRKSESGALESKAGWKGLCRKCVTLLFVLVAYRLDLALGVDYIRNAVIIGFITNELISLVENAGLMGVPLPVVISKAIDILTNQKDKEDTDDGNSK
jgi:toxin secretion/phage lysis holin